MKKSNVIVLVLCIIALVVLPLVLKDAAFEGADGEAEAVIQSDNPDYTPWFHPIFEPASGEIESLLFALQAALGAIVIGYYFGYVRGRKSAGKHGTHPPRR